MANAEGIVSNNRSSSQQSQNDNISLNFNKPIDSINVEFLGLKAINPSIVLFEVNNLKNVSNLSDLVKEVSNLEQVLRSYGSFSSVRTELDWKKDAGVFVRFHVNENRGNLSMGASVNQRGQGSVDINAKAPCLLRRHHNATLDANISQEKDIDLQAAYTMPRTFQILNRFWDLSFHLYNQKVHNIVSSSCTETSKGARLKIFDSEYGTHQIIFESCIRKLIRVANGNHLPSFGIYLSPDEKYKNSIKYGFSKQWSLFAPFFASYQSSLTSQLQGSIETAALHKGVSFVKPEIHILGKLKYYSNWLFNFRCSLGFMNSVPLNTMLKKSPLSTTDSQPRPYPFCIQDRFFLGGSCGSTSILNGFGTRQLGPVSPRRLWRFLEPQVDPKKKNVTVHPYDYLGGSVYSSLHLSIARELTQFQKQNGFTPSIFVFGNAGTLGNSIPELCTPVYWRRLRIAAGIGISLPIGNSGAFEVLLAKPLRAEKTDVTNTFQAMMFETERQNLLNSICAARPQIPPIPSPSQTIQHKSNNIVNTSCESVNTLVESRQKDQNSNCGMGLTRDSESAPSALLVKAALAELNCKENLIGRLKHVPHKTKPTLKTSNDTSKVIGLVGKQHNLNKINIVQTVAPSQCGVKKNASFQEKKISKSNIIGTSSMVQQYTKPTIMLAPSNQSFITSPSQIKKKSFESFPSDSRLTSHIAGSYTPVDNNSIGLIKDTLCNEESQPTIPDKTNIPSKKANVEVFKFQIPLSNGERNPNSSQSEYNTQQNMCCNYTVITDPKEIQRLWRKLSCQFKIDNESE